MTTVIAAVLGGLVAFVAFALGAPSAGQDESMLWEARVAAGFTGLIAGGPLWLAQGIFTLIAGGGWLWLWWLAAPLAGLTLARVFRH